MKPRTLILTVLFPLLMSATEKNYPLPAAVPAVVEDEAAFAVFAAPVAADVETQLAATPAPALAKMLLAIRVHHSLHTGADARALDSAARIKALLPEDANKAYAGLTAQAFVAARQASGGRPGDGRFNAAFARDFAARLAQLPATPAMRAVLESQREKFAGMTAESLRGEIAAIGSRREGTLAEADQLIRLRHRLADLLPLRAELLRALETAIAARPKS